MPPNNHPHWSSFFLSLNSTFFFYFLCLLCSLECPFHHEQNWTILNSSWCVPLIVSLKWNMACPRRLHSPSCFLCWKAATAAHSKGRRPISSPLRWLPDNYSSIFMCDSLFLWCSIHQLCLNRSHGHFAKSLRPTPISVISLSDLITSLSVNDPSNTLASQVLDNFHI